MKHRFTLIALATALAACNLVASQANTVAATANNAVLILEPAPCGGIEVVVLYVEKFNIVEHNNQWSKTTSALTSSRNPFSSISGKFEPTFPAAAANSHLSAALLTDKNSTPVGQQSVPLFAVTENRTAAIICADVSGHGAPRKIAYEVPMFAGFVANPSLSNMTWGMATETALMSPAAG